MCTIWSLAWIYAESYSVHFEKKTNKRNSHLSRFFSTPIINFMTLDWFRLTHTVLTDFFSLYENARKAPRSLTHFLCFSRPSIQLQYVYGHTTGAKNIRAYTWINLFLKRWSVDTAAKVCKHEQWNKVKTRERERENEWEKRQRNDLKEEKSLTSQNANVCSICRVVFVSCDWSAASN